MSLILACLGGKLEVLEMGEGNREMNLCPKCLTGCTAELETRLSWNVGQTLKKLNGY